MAGRQRNDMQHLTWQTFQQIIESLTCKKKFLVAYSGGLDSQVLLSLLTEWAIHDSTIQVRVIHINHQLSPNANTWVSFCNDFALKHKIPFLTQEISIQQRSKEGVEAQARRLRYDAIKQHLLKEEVLLTAHHQNDQVETMLLHWLRGSGSAGLAGMATIQSLDHTQLIRPLLSFPKSALCDFAKQHHLTWINDESNECLYFKRNYVRKKIMPPLLAAQHSCLGNLTRTANHCAEAAKLLQVLADADLISIQHDQQHLNINDLLKFDKIRQRNILRRWLALSNISMPTTAQLKVLQEEVILAQKSADPVLHLGNMSIRRYQSGLYLVPALKRIPQTKEWTWDLSTVFNLPQRLGTLMTKAIEKPGGISIQKLGSNNVTVRFRQGGERMHPSKRSRGTSLKHLFQEWQVPPWQRDRWPLIFLNEQLVAVVNIDVARNVAAEKNEKGFQIVWQSSSQTGK